MFAMGGIRDILKSPAKAYTFLQGVQGDRSPPAGVWGVPSSLPSYSFASAEGISQY